MSAAIFLPKMPETISRPPTIAASLTLLVSFALNAWSTTPVVASILTRARRATPLTVLKLPPTYSELPLGTIAQTSPLKFGANVEMFPFAALKASDPVPGEGARRRGPGGRGDRRERAADVEQPVGASAILKTAPWLMFGV